MINALQAERYDWTSIRQHIPNCIKKSSACTPLGIADKFDTYEKALKNTLLNKFAIETPNNKLQEVTLQDGSRKLDYLPGTIMNYTSMHD